jgi:hypothetical protein
MNYLHQEKYLRDHAACRRTGLPIAGGIHGKDCQRLIARSIVPTGEAMFSLIAASGTCGNWAAAGALCAATPRHGGQG